MHLINMIKGIPLSLTFCFLLPVHVLLCQSDKGIIRTHYPKGSVYQEYQISLPDSNINGYFKRYTPMGKLLISGQFKNNQRSGRWVWFPNTEATYRDTVEVYDYDAKAEIYFRDTLVKGPRYPGGDSEFQNDIAKQLNFPKELITKYIGKRIIAQIKLGCTGRITEVNFSAKSDFRDKLIEAGIVSALTKEYPLWIPCKDPLWDSLSIRYSIPFLIKAN